MNSKDNFNPSKTMESDIIKELYKKTPLKKRPIQPCSLPTEEKRISPKPRACTVLEGRLSKRKMLKPTKKLIDSYAESTSVIEPSPKAMYVPVIKSTTESKTSTPVEMNNKAVNMAMAMAIPELKKNSVGMEVPSKTRKCAKAPCNKIVTKQVWDDFNFAIDVQKNEFNLRKRPPRTTVPNFRTNLKRRRVPIKTEDTSSECIAQNNVSSPEMPSEGNDLKEKQDSKRIPKQKVLRFEKDGNNAFTGSHLQNTYILSPELANIVGHKKMTASAIIEAINYVFLERNLFEADKKNVICDDELSEKLFAGKRRLRLDDVKMYLQKHLTPI